MAELPSTETIETWLGAAARRRLPAWAAEFVMFGLKQAWACLFGALMLIGLVASHLFWPAGAALARYDLMFIYAVAIQTGMLAFRLETPSEAWVVLLFHVTGTAMEIFKVSAGSWAYPEPALIRLWGVPLFSGFMYASVGSYMVRVVRGFHMRFAPFPPIWAVWALGAAIYANFFAHHFLPDARKVLFAATVLLFWRTRIWFHVGAKARWMPLPAAALLSSFFLWIAENLGTGTNTWLYAGQVPLQIVPLSKMGAWYLLLYVAFATVSVAIRPHFSRAPLRPAPREGLVKPVRPTQGATPDGRRPAGR